MPQLSSMQASAFASVVFLLTLLCSYFLPHFTITLSGLLIVIFLSVFVKARSSTIIAGLGSGVIVICFMIWQNVLEKSYHVWTQFVFILFLIFFSTLIVLYIKHLIKNMQLDKSHMASLFENATEGILVTNSKGEIVLANPAALEMFNYKQDELVGQLVETLIPKKYRAGHVQLRDGFYHHPSNREMGSGRDLFGQRKDGSNFPVEVSLSSYQQQAQTFVIAFVVDITHRKEIEQSMLKQQQQLEKVSNDIRKLNAELEAKVEERTIILKEALQRLEQSQAELSEALDKEKQLNEIKSRFVSMASHEFRTPLSAILSSASLLGKYTNADEQSKRDRHIGRIKDSVKHLNDLLEDFLSLGRLDEGKTGAVKTPINLKNKLENVIDDMKGILKEGQHFEYRYEGNEEIISDRNMIGNIMINLISNAVKFSDSGALISVYGKADDEKVSVSVTDQGIGISEEDRVHLFSTFFRGKNALNIQGTGLGLHIVKRYLDLIGGSIVVDSQLGQGTTVTFTIPVNTKENAENNFSY